MNLDLFVSIVNQDIFVSKLLLLISHDSTSSSYAAALHLCHISVPMTYLCNHVILLHLNHTLYLCFISATKPYLSLCHILHRCHTLFLCHPSASMPYPVPMPYPAPMPHFVSMLYPAYMLYPCICAIPLHHALLMSVLYSASMLYPVSVPYPASVPYLCA